MDEWMDCVVYFCVGENTYVKIISCNFLKSEMIELYFMHGCVHAHMRTHMS